MKIWLKNLIMKTEKEVSWTKIWAWITSLLTAIILLHSQITAAGVPIPADMMPIFKTASIISGLITALRMRNANNGNITPPAAEPAKDGK